MRIKVSNLPEISIFWFRRDLRLQDNAGLFHALSGPYPVLPLYIFDKNLMGNVKNRSDRRIQFIHQNVTQLRDDISKSGGSLLVLYGDPQRMIKSLLSRYNVKAVYTNRDYEPYGRKRDFNVAALLVKQQVEFRVFKDLAVFEASEILNSGGGLYEIYSSYAKQWRAKFKATSLEYFESEKKLSGFLNEEQNPIPSLEKFGFQAQEFEYPKRELLDSFFEENENSGDVKYKYPSSKLGLHLRYGTISVRSVAKKAAEKAEFWIKNLIWREYYMMMLYHYPGLVHHPYNRKFEKIKWVNNKKEFQAWCQGKTGFGLVDAGMRELNATGYMPHSVRRVAAHFLTKFLLVDWRWGEKYFEDHLLDFELASNNGNWQRCVGSDAEVLNKLVDPEEYAHKLDSDGEYRRKWVPEINSKEYPNPIIDLEFAKKRSAKIFKKALK